MTIATRLLAGAALTAIASPALAQQAPIQLADADTARVTAPVPPSASPSTNTDAADEPDTIIVTGVRGQRARTVADSPVPIDVLGAQELKSTGRTGLKEILSNIVPSLIMPALGGGGTSASVKPIAIRGLSGDYLLVLVNGKRRHTTSLINNLSRISGGSSPVDIDLIPTSAVGHIEVLRDGAAAQYGSDAISGVINIILDSEPKGGELSFTGGQQYSKGAPLYQIGGSYGTRLGGDGGFIRLAVEAKYHDRAKSSALAVPYIYPLVNGQPDPREASADHVFAGGYGRSNRDEMIDVSYNAELPVGEVKLYSFSTFSYRDIKDARGAFIPSPTGYNGLANASVNSVLTAVYPDGFQAYRRIWERDFQATLGARGVLAGWNWDLSTAYGQDHVRLGAENTLNPTLGPTSPTSFYMGTQIQTLWVNNLDLTRDYDVGLAKPLTVSAGFEHRWERFQSKAGEPNSYIDGGYFSGAGGGAHLVYPTRPIPSPGLVSFSGTSPADATSLSRNNVAGYIDLSTNITDGWFLGAAGRFEHYDDSAGNTGSWKISTRYELTRHLAIRGGINTGFRAPSLSQSGFSTTQNTGTVIGNVVQSTTSKFLPVNSAAAIALGAKALRPEKSLNFTAGVTYEKGPLHITIDAYQIRIDHRIVKTEFIGTGAAAAEIKALLVNNGVSGVDSAQFFINGVDTRTRGIDAVADYALRTNGIGTFHLSAAYSYNKTTILDIASNPAQLAALPVPITLFGRQAQRDLTVGLPHDKAVLTSDWSLGKTHALVRLTRFGSYTESSQTSASGDRTFGAKWVTDFELGYDITRNLNLAVGANNAFDVYPDKNGVVSYDGSNVYGAFAPFGLSGGFYYGRVTVRL